MKVYAPWTEMQVDRLRKRQQDTTRHPYTCGNDSSHPPLIPTIAGWMCGSCDYLQDWALIDISGEIM